MDKINPWAFVGMRKPTKALSPDFSAERQLRVMEAVLMKRYNMVLEDVYGYERRTDYIYVRHLLSYWMRKELELSLLVTAEHLHRDHTSIMYNVKQFQNRIDTNEKTPAGLRVHGTTVQKDYTTFIKEIMHRCL